MFSTIADKQKALKIFVVYERLKGDTRCLIVSEAPKEAPKERKYDSYNPDTFKTDDQKKEEVIALVQSCCKTFVSPSREICLNLEKNRPHRVNKSEI